jgi:GTPase SAR1 family protein
MIRKKVCLLGAFAVGKTSLVARFVKSICLDQYHTTVGVKVDKKTVLIEGREIYLIIWVWRAKMNSKTRIGLSARPRQLFADC